MPQYEDLIADPWPPFANLAERSATFQVELQGVKRDTLTDLATALDDTLERIDEVVLGVPEKDDTPLARIADGVADILTDIEHSIRIAGNLRGIEMTIYLSEHDLVISVPVEAVAPNAFHTEEAPESFQNLVELGLELADITRARAVYLLDDDDEFDIAVDTADAAFMEEFGQEAAAPIWERPMDLWPPTDDEAADDAAFEQAFSDYFGSM